MLTSLLALLLAGPTLAGEILVVHPFPIYSHTVPFRPIFKELGKRGHNITIVSSFLDEPQPEGFTQIKVDLDAKKMIELYTGKSNGSIDSQDCNGFMYQLRGIWMYCDIITEILQNHIKGILPPPTKHFDLVVIEPFFCQEFMIGLSHHYKAPIVATLPQPLTPAISQALGNPHLSAYIPNFRLPLTDEMSFFERVRNTLVDLFEMTAAQVYHFPKQDKAMRALLDNVPDLPYISDLFQNIALILIETHFSMNYPRPYLKNVVEVGGISVDVQKPLPKDLVSFMNDSSEGVIYFSWGSHYEAQNPEPILEALMDTFSRLKQRVIFKWANTNITKIPENVLVQTWVPQPALLRHKNLRLFISHCGLNSVYEAAYNGVPVVGTPQFGDQPHNSRLLEHFGMGVTVQLDQVSDKVTLLAAIRRVLSDPSFRENAEKRSRMLKDRPMSAVDEGAYWIEYVMKHGAESVRPASMRMPWYSLTLLDVYAFLFGIVLLTAIGVALCISFFRSQLPKKTIEMEKKRI